MRNSLHALSFYFFQQPWEEDSIIIPFLLVIMIIILGCDKREVGEKTGVQADGKIPQAAGALSGRATAKTGCPEWHPLRDVMIFLEASGTP